MAEDQQTGDITNIDEQHQKACRERSIIGRWRRVSLNNKVIVIATVAIAFATCVDVGVSYLQWDQMQVSSTQADRTANIYRRQLAVAAQQNKMLQQQLEETNGALVTFNASGLGDDGGAQIIAVNFGRYKATDVRVTSGMSVVELPGLKLIDSFPEVTKAAPVIYPPRNPDPNQISNNTTTFDFSFPVSAKEVGSHMAGKLGFKVENQYLYYNGFETIRDASCLVRVNIPPYRFRPPGQGEKEYGGYSGVIPCAGFDLSWRQMLSQRQAARAHMEKDRQDRAR